MKYSQGDVRIDSVSIHYYRTGGDKPPFVLLHGALSNGLSWMPVAEALAERFDVIMPDAQGHGLSGRVDPDFAFEKIADHTVCLLEILGISSPIIMGHSMGAGNAFQIGVRYPHVPRAIILEDGPGLTTREAMQRPPEEKGRLMRDAIVTKELAYLRMTREELTEAARKENPTWSERDIAGYVEARRQSDPGIIDKLAEFKATDIELAAKIICPTLLMIADRGILTPQIARKISEIWQARDPFSWVQIDGSGHGIHHEQFEKFMKVVNEFIKTIED